MPTEKSSLHLVDPELRPVLEVFKGFDVSDETLPILRGAPTPPALDRPRFKEMFVPRNDPDGDLRLLAITQFRYQNV